MKRNFSRWLSFALAMIMLITTLPMSIFATTVDTTKYEEFLSNLQVLEGYADEYAEALGKDAGLYVLNFIRTGVDRYLDENWTKLAGEVEVGFINYVTGMDEENNTNALALRDLETFCLPNGNEVDFGHMFGCMNISYLKKGSADLSGWAGDLCDLLEYCVTKIDVINENTDGSVESIADYIRNNIFRHDGTGYAADDFWGDMDAYYLVNEYKKGNGSFSALMRAYFDADLSDVDRTVYFMNNRFGVADDPDAVRKAIYESYSSDAGIKILEASRGLSMYNTLRQACCYAVADYIYSQATGQLKESVSDTAANGYYSVFSDEETTLAQGITQNIKYAQTVDGKQIVYYVATVDVNRDDVTIMANYKDNDPSKGWGMQTTTEQVEALVKNQSKNHEYFNAVVAINGDGFNIYNGTPAGLLVMDGKEWKGSANEDFFAILKDGSAMIGSKADYEANKDNIQEAVGAFGATLIRDGSICVTKNANYTSSRGSRTAIGITAEGKVVMVVLDGRQLPFSAGGALEELAQIMLEAGCVDAINLDGGGSTTYLSKPSGSDEIEVVNRPSDGYERAVATTLVAVSTAKPSNEFDRAIISSDYNYITAGTSMQFTVKGVSNTGNAAIIPEGSYWRVSDETLATIDSATGLFTAVATGTVVVEYVVNGAVVGSKTIQIVVPDDVKFVESNITAIYGTPKEIGVTVWYQGMPVAFTPMQDVVIVFLDTEDVVSPAGTIDDAYFTGNESSGIRTVSILAVLVQSEDEVVAITTISMYKSGEATFDFENATAGNRKLAWLREVENARTTDNQLYRISDPTKPVTIDYTFALDMQAIELPAQLEPLQAMLEDEGLDGASAWTLMLSWAERLCTQTNVTIRAQFSQELDVDITDLKIVNDYFETTSVNLDANNLLTIVVNWKDQTSSIDPATANSLCILTGIKATVKDSAAYYNNEVSIANTGTVSYDVYLATSSLYDMASDPANQELYGLYPYEHTPGCRIGDHDKGARFSSQYVDYFDYYMVNKQILQGWQEEDGEYYYYENNIPVTGVQLVPDRSDSSKDRFYEFDENGKLVSEQGMSGLIELDNALYYAVLGVAQTGWQTIDGNCYYFHPDTGKAVDGVYTIKEYVYPGTTWPNVDEYTYTFTDYVLTRGEFCYDYAWSPDGYCYGTRYRWAGDWMKACWFEVDGNTYHVDNHEPYFITTGYGHYIKNYPDEAVKRSFLFDENGVLQKHFTGVANVVINGVEKAIFFKNGERFDDQHAEFKYGIQQANDGYYYYINTWEGEIAKDLNNTYLTGDRASLTNGFVPAGVYTFDSYGRMTNALIEESIIDNQTTKELTANIQGSVVNVQEITSVGGLNVGYYLENGEFVQVEANVNTIDGGYDFTVSLDATKVVVVVSGDATTDGKIDASDVKDVVDSVVSDTTEVTDKAGLAADVDGDGKITAADLAFIIASGAGKLQLGW